LGKEGGETRKIKKRGTRTQMNKFFERQGGKEKTKVKGKKKKKWRGRRGQ